MKGIKISISLEMPKERPDVVGLCEECELKHDPELDCPHGVPAAGELGLPALDKTLTGRELIDEDKKDA